MHNSIKIAPKLRGFASESQWWFSDLEVFKKYFLSGVLQVGWKLCLTAKHYIIIIIVILHCSEPCTFYFCFYPETLTRIRISNDSADFDSRGFGVEHFVSEEVAVLRVLECALVSLGRF